MMVKQKSSFINFFCRAVQKISLYKKDEKICMERWDGQIDGGRLVCLSIYISISLLCLFSFLH